MTRLRSIRSLTNEELLEALEQITHLEATGLWPDEMPYWVELVSKALGTGIDINKASEEIFREAAFRFKTLVNIASGKLSSVNKLN